MPTVLENISRDFVIRYCALLCKLFFC